MSKNFMQDTRVEHSNFRNVPNLVGQGYFKRKGSRGIFHLLYGAQFDISSKHLGAANIRLPDPIVSYQIIH
ncbi:hypothetical protein MtrunA17_Chr8g0339241 [Medicago truncatula]|uniref:Uncharacterized protein n=1 Tax=Medicago truncatula TaxID=3880 RepID=G7LF74_MEDTR|nr:hypothetical protein MTR_8g012470 [Medicago truncatula]RHN39007.1 hypothetical protein MtrunA17_Chr8g0339241 [Medicago truncatula]